MYPVVELHLGAARYGLRPDGWRDIKVLWIVAPAYPGPIVIRGRQHDGSSSLRFATSNESNPAIERIVPTLRMRAAKGWNKGWRDYPATLLVRRDGCYSFTIAGSTFVRTITLRVHA